MRTFVVTLFVLVVGCTRPNPDFCDSDHPCEAGQACTSGGMCVASECDTSAECTDPSSPVCIGNLCVASCTADEDCNGSVGAPHCAADGACVGCVDASQCAGDTNICDAETRSCRGCERDDECASGVCIEATAVCAAPSSIMYLGQGGADAGQCTDLNSPCRTVAYALQQATTTRNVIRLRGAMLEVAPSTAINRAVIIDGSSTRLYKSGSMPIFTVDSSNGAFGQVILEGVILSGTGSDDPDPAMIVTAGSVLHFARDTRIEGVVKATSSTIIVTDAVVSGAIRVTDGTLSVDHVLAAQGAMGASNSQVRIDHSTFQRSQDGMLNISGGLVVVENTLFEQSYELSDSIRITACAPGSTFRFNTVVNTSGVDSDGQAMYCDASIDVTSNIFAYRSQHPHAYNNPCPTRYSLYDTVALPEVTGGEGTRVAAIGEIFADLAGKDFHLATASAARDAGEAGLNVIDDNEGRSRGAMPDIGAFEAP